MLTVSVRPNLEVMKMPPSWIPEVFTLEGYAKIFSNPRYLLVFLNTAVVSLIVTAISLFLGAMAAYALARFKFIGQRTVLMFLITTQMFPLVLLCIPYFRIFITLGLYDTRTSLVIVYLTFTLPFCILMLRSYFMNIPRDIEEAAMVDGCTRLGAIFRTLVPMSYPAFIGAGLYTFLLAWNEFLFAVVLIEVLGEPRPDHGDLQPHGGVRDRLERHDGFLGPGEPAPGGGLHLSAAFHGAGHDGGRAHVLRARGPIREDWCGAWRGRRCCGQDETSARPPSSRTPTTRPARTDCRAAARWSWDRP